MAENAGEGDDEKGGEGVWEEEGAEGAIDFEAVLELGVEDAGIEVLEEELGVAGDFFADEGEDELEVDEAPNSTDER